MSPLSSYESQLVAQVLHELMVHVTTAIRKQGGNFWTGCYTGASARQFCDALRIEIEEVDAIEEVDLCGEKVKKLTWYFQPTLRRDAKRNMYLLQIPRSRLLAHGNYKIYSYALRALADFHLVDLVRPVELRKELAWDFCDRVRWRYNAHEDRMRTNEEISLQLESVRSPQQLHADDIPLSQMAAFMTRARPDKFSFSVFYMKNMREHLSYDEPTDCEMLRYRALGNGSPRVEVMVDCHCAGQIDIMSDAAMHSMISSPDGCEHLVISDTPFRLSDYVSRDIGNAVTGLFEVNRTVLFTMDQNAAWVRQR